MIVELLKEITYYDFRGKEMGALPAGFVFRTVDYSYLADHVKDQIGRHDCESVRDRKSFIFYLQGYWIVVPKEICYIPPAIGWRYNL